MESATGSEEASAAEPEAPAEQETDSAPGLLPPEKEVDSAAGDTLPEEETDSAARTKCPEEVLSAQAKEEEELRLQLLRAAQDEQREVELQRDRRSQQLVVQQQDLQQQSHRHQQQQRASLYSVLADQVNATSWITLENFRAERNRAFDKAFAAQRLSDYETRLTAPTTTIHDYVKMVKSRVLLGGPVVIAPAPSQAEEDQYLKQFAAESNAKNARATAEAVAEVRAANAEAKAAEMRVKTTAKLIRDNEKESKRQQKAKSAAAAAASKAADATARAARAKLRAEVAADGAAPADAAAPTTASSEDGSTTRVPKRQKKSAATPLPAPPVGCGLVNKGSTCYANAVLQCLTHTPPLCEKLLAREHSNDCARKDNSACWLCWLESHVRNAFLAKTPISPQMGGASIVNAGPGFRTGKQEDAHEYLRHLLDELQQAAKLNSVRNQGGRTGQDEDYFPFSLKIQTCVCTSPAVSADGRLKPLPTRARHSAARARRCGCRSALDW